MGNKIIWALLILLISFAACGKSSKNNVARQAPVIRQQPIEKIDPASPKEDKESIATIVALTNEKRED
jgi:hypothetical protein